MDVQGQRCVLLTPVPSWSGALLRSQCLCLAAGPTDGANGGSGGDHAHHVTLAARAAQAIKMKAIGGKRPMVETTLKGFFGRPSPAAAPKASPAAGPPSGQAAVSPSSPAAPPSGQAAPPPSSPDLPWDSPAAAAPPPPLTPPVVPPGAASPAARSPPAASPPSTPAAQVPTPPSSPALRSDGSAAEPAGMQPNSEVRIKFCTGFTLSMLEPISTKYPFARHAAGQLPWSMPNDNGTIFAKGCETVLPPHAAPPHAAPPHAARCSAARCSAARCSAARSLRRAPPPGARPSYPTGAR